MLISASLLASSVARRIKCEVSFRSSCGLRFGVDTRRQQTNRVLSALFPSMERLLTSRLRTSRALHFATELTRCLEDPDILQWMSPFKRWVASNCNLAGFDTDKDIAEAKVTRRSTDLEATTARSAR